MDLTRALIVYYSRTGTTRVVAQAIREEFGCRIETIADRRRRSGLVGYLRSGFDATFHRLTVLRPINTNPNDYDLVIVGTPIWNASVSAPVRTFLYANRDGIRHVAFFCKQGGRGSARAFRQMETVCGQKPVATLVVGSDAVRRADLATKVQAFASALKSISLGERPAMVGSLRTLPA